MKSNILDIQKEKVGDFAFDNVLDEIFSQEEKDACKTAEECSQTFQVATEIVFFNFWVF